MPIIQVILILIVIGTLVGLVERYGKEWIAAPWLMLIRVVAIIGTVLWLLFLLLPGPMGSLWNFRTPR
jgi:hypothetical protein